MLVSFWHLVVIQIQLKPWDVNFLVNWGKGDGVGQDLLSEPTFLTSSSNLSSFPWVTDSKGGTGRDLLHLT